MPAWVLEVLIQGACIREYHLWEKDAKEYFGFHLLKCTGSQDALKRKKNDSFVDIVRRVAAMFDIAHVENELIAFDVMRNRVNTAKHEAGLLLGHFFDPNEYWAILDTEESFWEKIEGAESFSL